jgi:hypothetical protein
MPLAYSEAFCTVHEKEGSGELRSRIPQLWRPWLPAAHAATWRNLASGRRLGLIVAVGIVAGIVAAALERLPRRAPAADDVRAMIFASVVAAALVRRMRQTQRGAGVLRRPRVGPTNLADRETFRLNQAVRD